MQVVGFHVEGMSPSPVPPSLLGDRKPVAGSPTPVIIPPTFQVPDPGPQLGASRRACGSSLTMPLPPAPAPAERPATEQGRQRQGGEPPGPPLRPLTRPACTRRLRRESRAARPPRPAPLNMRRAFVPPPQGQEYGGGVRKGLSSMAAG
jgi:hypothetical protein